MKSDCRVWFWPCMVATAKRHALSRTNISQETPNSQQANAQFDRRTQSGDLSRVERSVRGELARKADWEFYFCFVLYLSKKSNVCLMISG